MIQVQIPCTQTLVDGADSQKSFIVYDIHVNGAFHASVRYSHLCTLHEKLIENFGFRLSGPDFPPKKIWRTLDAKGLSDRREALVRYFQGLIQVNDVSKHSILERAFLEFQVSSYNPSMQATSIEVYLPDGHSIHLEVYADDSTAVVLKKFCRVIKMQEKLAEHFGLFLAKEREEKSNGLNPRTLFDYVCVRWLKNFESPYISQKLANKGIDDEQKRLKITIRRVMWDVHVEEPLLEDPGALKLLFLQALNDVQHNFYDMSTDTKNELSRLHESNDYRGFMKICHKLPTYGFEVLESVISDYPSENTKCCFKIGRRMIVLQYTHDGRLTQALLKSTRIRTWKISHTDGLKNPKMTFQIEYVLGSGVDLMTFQTNQAILISLFLQSIADEILRDCRSESPTYKFDDSIQTKVISNMKTAMENSIVNKDGSSSKISLKDHSDTSSTCSSSGLNNNPKINPLLQIISYQMPFEGESFDFVTDADL